MKKGDLFIKLKRKKVFSESTTELSYLLVDEFATKTEIKTFEWISSQCVDEPRSRYGAEAESISIAELRKLINKAEKAGATHISIDYHQDHGEYDVYGYAIERMSDVEIKALEDKILKEKETLINNQIAELQEELKQLRE